MTPNSQTLLSTRLAAVITEVTTAIVAASRSPWTAVSLVVWLGLAVAYPAMAADEDPGQLVRSNQITIGIGPGIFVGVNRNDASAGIKVWAKSILNEHEHLTEVETRLFDVPGAIGTALKDGQIDAASVCTEEFLALPPNLKPDTVFLETQNHALTLNYVLLVHQDAGIDDVAQLAGLKLVLQANSRTSLALPWFETLLAQHSMGSAEKVLKTLTRIESPSKPILEVFFHAADACLVTSNVFELACELNPQLRKELKVLAVSPAVIPTLFFFRPSYLPQMRDRLESAILSMNETPAGREVLTVFQSDGMMKCQVSCLESTRQLLAEYDRARKHQTSGSPPLLPQTAPRG
jgi:phosphonate transport system substrate-binding protein